MYQLRIIGITRLDSMPLIYHDEKLENCIRVAETELYRDCAVGVQYLAEIWICSGTVPVRKIFSKQFTVRAKPPAAPPARTAQPAQSALSVPSGQHWQCPLRTEDAPSACTAHPCTPPRPTA